MVVCAVRGVKGGSDENEACGLIPLYRLCDEQMVGCAVNH